MNIDRLYAQFSNEGICRRFFESARWPNGRICPHCGCNVSYRIRIKAPQVDRYECKRCTRHFTVTTKTVLHSTKLPLRKWLLAMYLIVTSSKGISSVVLARLIGVTQPTAWRMGHAIRLMMDPKRSDARLLKGVVELDEKYVGGTPEPRPGVLHKRGKGTSKQRVLIAVERHGPARAVHIDNEKVATLQPIIERHIDKGAHLMSDGHRSYLKIGQQFDAHSHVNHSKREFSRGQVHCNTAESFSSLFERAKIGVFHYLSPKHLSRYLNEFGFRWEQRVPEERTTKSGVKKIQMKPIPVVDMLVLLIMRCTGSHLRRTKQWGILDITFA